MSDMQDKPSCGTAETQSKTSTQPQAGTERLQLLRTLSIQVLGISKHLLLTRATPRAATALQVCFLDSVFLFLTGIHCMSPARAWPLLEQGEMSWYES